MGSWEVVADCDCALSCRVYSSSSGRSKTVTCQFQCTSGSARGCQHVPYKGRCSSLSRGCCGCCCAMAAFFVQSIPRVAASVCCGNIITLYKITQAHSHVLLAHIDHFLLSISTSSFHMRGVQAPGQSVHEPSGTLMVNSKPRDSSNFTRPQPIPVLHFHAPVSLPTLGLFWKAVAAAFYLSG